MKELFKTAKGKYVAPAPIENRLNAHPMVELAHRVGRRPAGSLRAWWCWPSRCARKLGDAAVRARVEADSAALLRAGQRRPGRRTSAAALVVAREPWSIENGCLTPTMKIKRSRIEAAVAAQVEGWYAQPGPVLWA